MQQTRPENVGILAMEVYVPRYYVNHHELEKFDGVSEGKYTIGLGLQSMAFVSDREDTCTMALTATQNLMENFEVDPSMIGRMEVGTESPIDKSKSIKSVLMALFRESGNHNVEGVDCINACYGGTAAIFNSIAWVESRAWDGRLALVICSDIAVYAPGPARPTGGACCTAILIGPDAPLVFNSQLRTSHMEHTYDFYKPDFTSEFPVVHGGHSIQCFNHAIDENWKSFKKLGGSTTSSSSSSSFRVNDVDYFVFHSPYSRLVNKSFARMVMADVEDDGEQHTLGSDSHVRRWLQMPSEKRWAADKKLFRHFEKLTYKQFMRKVEPSCKLQRKLGNSYTACMMSGLASLISYHGDNLCNSSICLFSFGSGYCSSLFSLDCVKSVAFLAKAMDISGKLSSRIRKSPQQYTDILERRGQTYSQATVIPESPLEDLRPGTYYLVSCDKFQRVYGRHGSDETVVERTYPVLKAKL